MTIQRGRAKVEAVEVALELRLAATRVAAVEAADLPDPLVNILLVLKERPKTPAEIARRLEVGPGYVRSTLRRYLDGVAADLIERREDGRYRLTLKGHRRANAIGAAGLFARERLLSETVVTGVPSQS